MNDELDGEPLQWPRRAAYLLGGYFVLKALGAWFGWMDAKASQPVPVPTTLSEFVIPLTFTALATGILAWAVRSMNFGIRKLIVAAVTAVVVFVALFVYVSWHEHRNDYGNPNDFSRPWRRGGMEFSPGESPPVWPPK